MISYCIHYECTARALIPCTLRSLTVINFFLLLSMGSRPRSMVHPVKRVMLLLVDLEAPFLKNELGSRWEVVFGQWVFCLRAVID